MARKKSIKRILIDYLSDKGFRSKKAFYFDAFVVFLILISSAIFVALTYNIPHPLKEVLVFVDTVIIMLFTVEYFARIYVAKRKINYIFSLYGIIDLLAFLPYWLSFFVPFMHSLQFLRVFRVLKMFRFFKEYLDHHKRISQKDITRILVAKVFFVLFMLVFVSSSLIYTLEADVNPNINTFDDAVYFSVVTLTTVGFGDITPHTRSGRMAVTVLVMLGIILIPVYIASLMRSYMTIKSKKRIVCKNCGLTLHDPNAVYCKLCGAKLYVERDDDMY